MVLKEILYKVALEVVHGSTEIEVNNIHFDSRKIENKVFSASSRPSKRIANVAFDGTWCKFSFEFSSSID